MWCQLMTLGLRDGTAVGLTAGLLGLMYALAALESGLRPLETVFYSLVVYSAAVQFAALGADTAPGALLALISGSLFICTRNVLMSLDMARDSRGRLVELLSMAGLVDAAWAMTRGYKKEDVWGYFWGQAIAIYVLWMAGTIAGVGKSGFRNFRMRRASSEQQESSDNSSDKASEPREQSSPVDSERGTNAKGTLTKIIDAVSENETVKFIKKKIWG